MGLSFEPRLAVELRPYQADALERWQAARHRGVVVLPTGAGKTAVGCGAIAQTLCRTLVVVPTIELLDQWRRALHRDLNVPREQIRLGFPSEGDSPQLSLFPWEPPDVLIATYAGASQHTQHLHHFGLLIFDEVHHLPAPVFRSIAERAPADARLGLTATPERYDQAHHDLDHLVGPIVFRAAVDDLAHSYLAPHQLHQVLVDLTPTERGQYDLAWRRYVGYVRRSRLKMPQGYQELIKRAGRDGQAKQALEGHHQARAIALSASRKAQAVRDLLEHHDKDRVLIFCHHVETAISLGQTLGKPVVTHETSRSERARLLDAFRHGDEQVLVATSILDEGVDVPDATIGIVVSGSGQPRQFVQRLGRLIRPAEGKAAHLYEIVARNTLEERSAARRKSGLRKPAGR